MSALKVSEDQHLAVRGHLQLAADLQLGQGVSQGQKLAWLRKARAILLILDPRASKPAGDGIVSRTYWDLTGDLDRLSKLSALEYHNELSDRFEAGIASLEAVSTCIEIAPGSLITTELRSLNPYFFDLPEETDENLVFVLMPFTESWSKRIWESHIKPIIEGIELEPPLECKRADDLYGHDVLLDIVAPVKVARVVVADITSRNPNVFYELGIAHSFARPVVLLTQTVEDIPFDLLRFRHIVYEDNSDGYARLAVQLQGAILEAIA